jgi:16S rRNA (guanine(966)-N(2))-methyltransferase RsmD
MDLRPTADRLRETLFDVLAAGNPSALQGTVWLDLYAGTGAVGIEALSRGARMVYFVESSVAAAQLVRQNLQSLNVDSGWKILKQDVTRALRELDAAGVVADFVFLDPPYRLEQEYLQTLQLLAGASLLRPESLVVAEHLKRFELDTGFGRLSRVRKLEQGDAALTFYAIMKPAVPSVEN